jgi:hypothetical protein
MSRRLSINSVLSNSFINLQSPQVTKRDSIENKLLKSSLRKTSYPLNNSLENLPSLSCFDNEVFLKAYNKAKRKSVIISTALDDNIRGCIRSSIRNERLRCTPGSINEALHPLLAKIEEYDTKQERIKTNKKKKKENSISSINTVGGLNKPRFGSQLSRDGQYALLKSYEDIIVSDLQTLYPELKNRLQRTKTVNNLKDGNSRRSSNSSDYSAGSYDSSSRRTSNQSTVEQSFAFSPMNDSQRNSLTSSTSFFDLNFNNDVDYEKKVKVSQKLEYAMDIIDNLKLIKASKKTNSKKYSNLSNDSPADSVLKYNEWRNEWTELIDLD